MLKTEVIKTILSYTKLSVGSPFYIKGESCPYRFKRDGSLERFKGQTWCDSSYAYYDIIGIADSDGITICTDPIEEYTSEALQPQRRRKKATSK